MPRPTAAQRADARLLREAARLVEKKRETYSCVAIEKAQKTDEVTALERSYRAMIVEGGDYLWTSQFDRERFVGYSPRDLRILALCFAAAMAETGDL